MDKPTILYTIINPPVSRPNYHVAYQKAIELAGGTFEMLSPDSSAEEIESAIKNADGFLIPGGSDLDPSLYHEEKKEYTKGIDIDRDSFEAKIIRYAIEKNIPALGICRGMQIMNIVLGGSLYQDVKIEKPNALNHDGHDQPSRSTIIHDVKISDNSRLASIVGVKEVGVNSLHHQGVHKLGEGLIATAVASDGLIEAIEFPSHKFFVGVQWHPEELGDTSEIWRNLFLSFIKVANGKSLK